MEAGEARLAEVAIGDHPDEPAALVDHRHAANLVLAQMNRSLPAPHDALVLDGSRGEGGGQILRTALGLAVALHRPVALTRIRAGRPKPGLQPQHLAVVRALAAIGDADVEGDAVGSTALRFTPHGLRAGSYRFDVAASRASAGSVSLLFQAVLLPLLFAPAPSRLTLSGGTHVPWSPPAHYLGEVFLPALADAGVDASVRVRRWGWYPAGGGELEATIEPTGGLRGWTPPVTEHRGPVVGLSAVSRLPRSIAERQRRRAEERLAPSGLRVELAVEEDTTARGPGTFLLVAARGRAGASALGRRGVPAERVADEAVDAFLAYRAAGADVDEHLADQLLPFLALARTESRYTCPVLSGHLRTVAWVVEQFLPVRIALGEGPPAHVSITPGAATA